jgi:hypothetical protein
LQIAGRGNAFFSSGLGQGRAVRCRTASKSVIMVAIATLSESA